MNSVLNDFWDFLGASAFSAAILAGIGYLFRNTIAGYFVGKIEYKNKKRLTKFEDQLNRERAEIDDIRRLILSGTRLRNEKLFEKQLWAAEAIWAAVCANKKHSIAVKFLQSVNVEAVDEEIRKGTISEFVDVMFQTTGIEAMVDDAGEKESPKEHFSRAELTRPFISPVAWALYSTHTSISYHAVASIVAWKHRQTTTLLKNEELVQAAKKALPHQAKFIDEFGIPGTYYLLDEIEEALLVELRRFIKSGTTDQEAMENAMEILNALAKAPPLTHPSSTH